MNSLFSVELVEGCSRPFSRDGEPSAMSRKTSSASESFGSGLRMDTCQMHHYSAISEHSFVKGTPSSIKEWLMSSVVGSLARHSALPQEEGTLPPRTCGQKPLRSYEECGHVGASLRTSLGSSPTSQWYTKTSLPKAIQSESLYELPPPAWVPRTCDGESGYLPTATTKLTADSPSMLKHKGHQRLNALLGGSRSTVRYWEWMMGWPLGWTALEPLATDKFQQWRDSFLSMQCREEGNEDA